jgi:hypothetical protein
VSDFNEYYSTRRRIPWRSITLRISTLRADLRAPVLTGRLEALQRTLRLTVASGSTNRRLPRVYAVPGENPPERALTVTIGRELPQRFG